jgi:hypothetical protein
MADVSSPEVRHIEVVGPNKLDVAKQALPPGTTAVSPTAQPAEFHERAQDFTTKWLAYVTTIGFFILILALIAMSRWPGDKAEVPFKETLLTLMGVVGAGWAAIISFYFGSSVGSQQSQPQQNAAPGRQPA